MLSLKAFGCKIFWVAKHMKQKPLSQLPLDHLKLKVNFHNLCVDIIPMEICV